MHSHKPYFPAIADIRNAAAALKGVATVTPFTRNIQFSKDYDAEIFLKREDLQVVRSYKIRGAYNKMSSLSEAEKSRGIVTASAGNHAQGVAYACSVLKMKGTIYMPEPTPQQKVEQVKMFGGDFVEIVMVGDTFDDAQEEAMAFCVKQDAVFIHPFDDPKTIEGQATIGLEILEQSDVPIDYLFVAVGGGGLSSGLCGVFKELSPNTKIIGVEPKGAPSMSTSIANGKNTELEKIDKFIDGAAVKRSGDLNFAICKSGLENMITVDEGRCCQIILDLYNKQGVVVEPAGTLSLAALDQYKKEIKGKKVVCIISGGNNDITRTSEIQERALLFGGLKHYFSIRFPQRAGALKDFVNEILGPNDDITFFEYSKRNNREKGPAIVGILLKKSTDLQPLMERMKERGYFGEYLNETGDLLRLLT